MLIASPIKVVWGTTVLVDETAFLDDESLNGSLADLVQRVVCPGAAGGGQYNRGNRTLTLRLGTVRIYQDYLAAMEAQLNLMRTFPQNVANAVVTLWDYSANADVGQAVAAKTWTFPQATVQIVSARCVSEIFFCEYQITATAVV